MLFPEKSTSSLFGDEEPTLRRVLLPCALCSLFITLFIVISAFASDPVIHDDKNKLTVIARLKQLRNSLEEITDSGAGSSENLSELTGLCRTILNDAIIRIETSSADFPDDYVTSLDNLIGFGKIIAESDYHKREEMTRILLKDLQLKFKPSVGSISTEVFAQLATTTIITKSSQGEAKNLRVRYAPLGYSVDFTKDSQTFPKLTSPSSKDLVPGYYLFWITQDNDKEVLCKIYQEVYPGRTNEIEMMVKVE